MLPKKVENTINTLYDPEKDSLIDQINLPTYINNFFSDIGNKLANQLKQYPSAQQKCHLDDVEDIAGKIVNNSELLTNEITHDKLQPILSAININKSPGIENIRSQVYKNALKNLSERVLYLLNMSIKEG